MKLLAWWRGRHARRVRRELTLYGLDLSDMSDEELERRARLVCELAASFAISADEAAEVIGKVARMSEGLITVYDEPNP